MYAAQPYIQIRYKSLVIYHRSAIPCHHLSPAMIAHIKRLREMAKYTGIVTKSTQKRIRQAVDKFLQLAKDKKVFNPITQRLQRFKLTFITLTVSENDVNLTATDAYHKLLRPFLRWLKESENVKLYLWKAELQQRGQIHYHITLNEFVHFEDIKTTWNNLQFKWGLLDSFKRKYGHYHPNSTDIHAVYKVKDIAAYLVKYLSKSEEVGESTTGKIWDCSTIIKSMRHVSFELNDTNKMNLDFANDERLIEVKSLDKCQIIKSKRFSVLTILDEVQRRLYKKYISDIVTPIYWNNKNWINRFKEKYECYSLV